MNTASVLEPQPAVRRPPRESSLAFLQRVMVQAGMFLCGVLCWVGTPKYSKGNFAFVVSPSQAGIPILGLVAFGYVLVQYRGRLPQFMRRTFASSLLVMGCLFILFGAGVHLNFGSLLQDTIVFLARWMMPFMCIILFWAATRLGGTYPPILYGLFVGAAISIAGVFLARAGLNIPAGAAADGRAAGFTSHPNQYGIIASGTAPFIVYFFLSRKRWQQVVALLAVVLYGTVLYQALSKTNIILFPIAIMATFLAASLNRPAAFIRSLVAMIMLGLLFAGLAFVGLQLVREMAPRAAQVIENSFEDPLNAVSVEQREGAWEEVTEYLKIHPIAGLGPGWAESHLMFTHAHNLYLQMYVDSGLIGFTGIISITLAVLLRSLQTMRGIIGTRRDLSDETRLQVAAGIALIISLAGNSMSSSLSIGTMTTFVVILAISFTQPKITRPAPAQTAPEPLQPAVA